ncbi:solute carrier family 25 member 45 isoform X2 [Homalodisca vitripennis]|uniref:solute carrier family 25 member 45 isoform X2 n=1 Tax=Homalodisca vitripennis TaxID=197043 RepID=UPI001EEA83D2|nr:solute carrier family 25 member 45 isoform X2 [Homalodisca vitripennis]
MSSVISGCDFVAGWGSGICGLVVGHPFDTVKVWKQTLPENSSATRVMLTLLKHEGVRGFYKGMMFPLLTAGALNSLYFGVYGNMMRELHLLRGVTPATCWDDAPYRNWHWDVFFSGCTGGLASVFVSCPVELVKTQLQTQTSEPNLVTKRFHQYHGPWDCLMEQYRYSGIRGCYRGFVPMLWREVPASGIHMLVYEHFQYTHGQERFSVTNKPDVFVYLMGGALAGVISWSVVVPLDVVKTRIQADSKSDPKYKNMLDCIIKSYKHDGITVFFRGYGVVALRALPVNAVTFVGYEFLISFCS